MQNKFIFMLFFTALLSFVVKGSEFFDVFTSSLITKECIASLTIESTCLWESQSGHDKSTCGFCIHENTGFILEKYKNRSLNKSLTIEKKSSFEPTYFLGAYLINLLIKLKPVVLDSASSYESSNKETLVSSKKEWDRCIKAISTRLNSVKEAIDKYLEITSEDSLNTSTELPEFIQKHRCRINLYMNLSPLIKNQLCAEKKSVEHGILKDKNERPLSPPSCSTIQFMKYKNIRESQTTTTHFGHVLDMFILTTLPAKKSKLPYKPFVKKRIIEDIAAAIEMLQKEDVITVGMQRN